MFNESLVERLSHLAFPSTSDDDMVAFHSEIAKNVDNVLPLFWKIGLEHRTGVFPLMHFIVFLYKRR